MAESISTSAWPPLSPGLRNACRLSRLLELLLSIGFWVTLVWLVAQSVLLVWPQGGNFVIAGARIPAVDFSFGRRAGAITAIFVGTGPSLLILYHASRLFAGFARGEIFVATAITRLRSIGLWLIIAAFASSAGQVLLRLIANTGRAAAFLDVRVLLLVIGVATYVGAHIMAEARRYADDNASIV